MMMMMMMMMLMTAVSFLWADPAGGICYVEGASGGLRGGWFECDYPTHAKHEYQPPPSPACPTQAEQGRDRRPLPLPGCQTQAHQR